MRGAASTVTHRWTTHAASATEALGEAIGAALREGDLVLLYGGLGSGKTTLVRGIARGMDVKGEVKSPTFALHLQYTGGCRLHHLDLYRLETPREILELGLDDIFGVDGVCVVEWAERLESPPSWAGSIRIEEGPDAGSRILTLKAPLSMLSRLQKGTSRVGFEGEPLS